MSVRNEDFRNCIVLNDEEFERFTLDMDRMSGFIEKNKNFEMEKEAERVLSNIINQVALSKEFFASMTANEKQVLRKSKKFYSDFFDSFGEDVCNKSKEICAIEYIRKNMREYFYMKKIYQLSNYLGVLYKDEWCMNAHDSCKHKSPLSDFPNIRHYLYLYYFSDFYSSFSKFLEPFLKQMWIGQNKTGHTWWPPYHTIEIYHIWQNAYRLNHIKPNIQFYNDIRNTVSHSTIYLVDGKIRIDSKATQQSEIRLEHKFNEDASEQIKKIKQFLYTAITFTTEFDLRMLMTFKESIKKKDAEAYDLYREYFELYYCAWKELTNSKTERNE